MGAYLSEPMKATNSEDGSGNGLRFGASTMQGWRASQEDAHNCVAQFDEKSSLYGVYDGHGGAEVATYVAQHFPDLLKSTTAYLEGNIEKAFIEAYLKMDASIKDPEVLKEIQRLSKLADGEDTTEAAGDEEEENVSELYEEATMPLDKLVAKYQNPSMEGVAKSEESSNEEKPCSSSKVCAASSSSSGTAGSSTRSLRLRESSSNSLVMENEANPEITADSNSSPEVANVNGDAGNSSVILVSDVKDEVEKISDVVKTHEPDETKNGEEKDNVVGISETSHCNGIGNGIAVHSLKEVEVKIDEAEINSSTTAEVNEAEAVSPTKPRKGKVHHVPIITEIPDSPSKRGMPRKATLAGLMAFSNEDDSSDFDSSDSDAPAPPDSNSDSDEIEEDDASSADEGDSEDDSEDEDDSFLNGMQEPGFDSGTTAVVSFLRWENDKLNLWVANAGDSRCVVSRNGTAIDMSFDHKPESEEETLRIVKAGGKVTDDGRVNGGLNLSRALGDHTYKQNQTLPPEEQMISPLPAVKHLELNPENDEFVVLACDGVWNSMSSQQVVDFVKERIATTPSLSKICEELFETCLAEDTCGDGTGCDNMTAIIVCLSKPSGKRVMKDTESDDVQEPAKRLKLDTE